MTTAPLLIADLPWLLYRSFHALPDSIVDGEGHPVNALLGTVNALLGMIEAFSPRAVALCTGAEDATYRVRLFEGYHAARPPMPATLRRQWEQVPQLARALGWVVVDAGELEADDAMGQLAREADAALILTADRDLWQAVSQTARMITPGRGGGAPAIVDVAAVRRLAGVEPARVPDLIALRGDPSDGIPGAPGVGAKTAAELLRAHGSLEDVLAAAATVTGDLRPRLAATLREHADSLRTWLQIASLQPLRVRLPADRATDFAAGAQQAQALGMGRLAERLRRLA